MKRKSRGVFAHLTVGLQLAATILVFVFVGHRLDLYYDRSPLFLALGLVLGLSIGFYSLLKELLGKKKGGSDGDDEDKRAKWM